MIIPAAIATAQSASPLGGSNDNAQPPSTTNLLMAAAQMHKLGRLKGQSKPKATKLPDEAED